MADPESGEPGTSQGRRDKTAAAKVLTLLVAEIQTFPDGFCEWCLGRSSRHKTSVWA